MITMIVMCACGLALGDAAAAEELTRSAYVEKLEASCKPRVLAIEQHVDGVRGDVHSGRLKAAGSKFAAAARIFGASVQSITPIPRPKEDQKQLAVWFTYLNQQESYMRKIADALSHDRSIQGQRDIARFVHSGNLANNAVFGWGFNYCAFKFSRFG